MSESTNTQFDYQSREAWADEDARDAVEVEEDEDDGSLGWAAEDWMNARGISSVDCHGRFVYEDD